MTNRHSGYIVALEHNIREDDAEAIINAIRMVKGVLTVKPVDAQPFDVSIAEDRARSDLWRKVHEVFYPPSERGGR